MEVFDIVLLTAAFALVASLYSSVGHAGASGYLACMALLSVPPTVMRPTALVLNVLAATITTISFPRWVSAVATFAAADRRLDPGSLRRRRGEARAAYLPGVGRRDAAAVLGVADLYDIPIIVGSTIIFAYLLAMTVFLLDFIYSLVDPRVKIGG